MHRSSSSAFTTLRRSSSSFVLLAALVLTTLAPAQAAGSVVAPSTAASVVTLAGPDPVPVAGADSSAAADPAARAARDRVVMKKIKRQVVVAGEVLRVKAVASDLRRGPRALRFRVKGAPSWLKLNKKRGVLRGRAPAASTARTYRLTLRVTDGKNTAKRSFKLAVQPAPNRAPVIAPVADTAIAEDAPMAPLPVAVTDPDGNPVTVAVAGLPAGLTFDQASRTVSGTPTVPGSYVVVVSATDGRLGATAGFRLQVTAVNDAPSISDQSMSVVAGASANTVIGRLVAADEEGAALQFGGGNSRFAVAPDGTVSVLDPSVLTNGAGPFAVPVSVSDGDKTAAATLTITVTPQPDRAPVVDDQSRSVPENSAVGSPVGGALVATDPDGDTVGWSITGGNSAGAFAIDPSTGQLSVAGPLDAEDTASHVLTVRVASGALADTAEVSITVTDVNEAPVLSPLADVTTVEDTAITPVEVEVSDPDGDEVALAVTGLPAGLTFDETAGTVTGTPTTPGVSTVTVTADDGTADPVTETFTITITAAPVPNRAPVIEPIGDLTTVEDTAIATIDVEVSDPDDDAVTVAVTGLPAGLVFDGPTATISGAPTTPGVSTVTVSADDGTADPVTETFTVTVTPAPTPNRAPVIVPIDDVTTVEDTAIATIDIEVSDPDGDAVAVAVTGLPAGLGFSPATGSITGTPTTPGVSTVTVTADDGTADPVTETFTITVTPAPTPNRAPVISPIDDVTTVEDTAITPIDVEVVDADDDDVTVEVTGLPAGLSFDETAGTISGTPTTPGVSTVTVTADDGTADPVTETFTITVTASTPANDAPVIAPIDDVTTVEDAPISPIVVQVVDADDDDVTVEVTGLPAGLSFDETAGTIAGTPTTPGESTVTVTADDGTADPVTETFTITVTASTPANDAPVIEPIDDVTTVEDAPISPIDVEVVDADDDDVTVEVTGLPAGLSFNETAGTITGTPTTPGVSTVTVTADDGTADPVTETFTITVTAAPPTNEAPVISPIDDVTTVEDAAITPIDVEVTDPDDDDVTVEVTGLPAGLSFDETADTITGTPTTPGVSTVTVTADDGTADPVSETFTITVTATPAGPCPPISTLPCSEVPVDLPFSLSFDGDAGGLDGTGFTMVDPPSQRSSVDQAPAPTTPSVPGVTGLEAGLLSVTGGNLEIQATKGIQFRSTGQDPAATAPNAQLNALGVGVSGSSAGYDLSTTVKAPTFPGSADLSQQGGLWFGLDEDNYVKAVVSRVTATTNKVQLLTEIGGVATPGATYELNSNSNGRPAFSAGQDVLLELEVVDTAGTGTTGGTAQLYYTVGTGQRTLLSDPLHTSTPTTAAIPQAFFGGRDVGAGAPQSFAGLFATKRNAAATDNVVVRFAGFDVETHTLPNSAPVLGTVEDLAAVEGEAVAPVTITATDPDEDEISLTSDLDVAGLTFTDNGDGTATLAGTPALGTATGSPYAVTITADDGTATDTAVLDLTVTEVAAPCAPISTEPCDTVRVDTPYVLSFDNPVSGLDGTGFTMVDDPSFPRPPTVDQAPAPATPSTPDVPGYEPGLLNLTQGGNLQITATKGIAYRNPAGSAGTNSQLNTLGVGLAGGTDGYELTTTVVNPTFPSSAAASTTQSQQGGLWFGLDEDNYVKVAVVRVTATTNKVQLVKEVGALTQPDTQYELNSTPFPAGQNVRLVLQVDGSGSQPVVRASFGVGDGELQPLTDTRNTVSSTALPLPAAFLAGAALPSGSGGPVSFGGVYATKRSAAATDNVVVSFADFSAELIGGVVEPFTPIDVRVDFTTQAGALAPGFLRDYGQAFGERSAADQGGGLQSYGWVKENSEEELSLVGNGRVRGRAGVAVENDSVIHMQYGDTPASVRNCTANVCEDGDWQLDVENGTYEVTVAVGDQMGSTSYDSLHAVNIENQVLLEEFQGTAAAEYGTATALVGVFDGELTVNATGGTNTKIAWVRVRSAGTTAADSQPFVVATRPANRSLGAPLGEGVAADVHLVGTTSNPGPVVASTVNGTTVRLVEVVPGGGTGNDVAVAGSPGTSGGGDIITFQQSADLKASTTYRLVIAGVKDALGNTFVPFTSLFTTGTGDDEPPAGTFTPVSGVDFQKVDTGKNGKYFASLVVHDGFLWTTTVGQGMFRYPILSDGTLGAEQVINAFAGRASIGLVFDRVNPKVAWVTHATANIGNESQEFGSKLSRVDFTLDPLNPVVTDVFVNLPRSQKDHLSNSIAYGPGGQLYFLQGSNQAAGDPDGAWGNRGETLLTAAMLTFDPVATWQRVQASGAVNVQTVDKGGPYDPFAANAPLKIYASGIRNAYDLVHTSTGRLFVPTNGTASGGNSPGVTSIGGAMNRTGQVPGDVTNVCNTRRIDGAPYTAPNVPAITNHNTQRDFLFDVVQGGYYGHPNPSRCEWVLNNGANPEGAGSGGSKYPAGVVPDRNYRGWAYDFEFNKSPNGVIEYRSNTFGGKLKGRLMVVRYSNFDDVFTLETGPGGTIRGGQAGSSIGGFSGFDDPLDIVEDLDTGNLYVNSYDQSSGQPRLYLLRVPQGQGGADVTLSSRRVIGNQVVSAGQRTLGTVTLTNEGQETATVTGASVSGAGAAAFAAVATPSFPATLAPGASMTVQVRFDPTVEGVAAASLGFTLASGTPVPSVSLRGLGTDGLGGTAEPSLQYVFDTWELGIDTGDDNDSTNEIHSSSTERVSPTLGDAIDAETFKRFADGPVTVEPISVFGPTDANPVTQVSWYDTAAPATLNPLFSASNNPTSNGQTLTPATTGALQFDPGQTTFGLVSRWPFFTNRLVHSQDSLNTFAGAIGNHVRVYPLVENGQPVPHAYVVATEEHTSGFDYNDVVYILRNVEPGGSVQPPSDNLRINFQSETAAVPAGYLRDFGQAYGARTLSDQGGRTYGWVNATSGAAEARIANGRDRNLNTDQRLDTFMHMQYQQQAAPNCTANNCNTGSWELALADGTYQVTVSLGDPATNDDPESHQVRAEGVAVLASPLVPTGPAGSAGHHSSGTQVVEVEDGKLTIDAVGGTNTKINYVEVEPVEGGGGQVVAQVNFQPAGAAPPTGWVADTGALFTAGRGYGWVRTEGGVAKTADTRQRALDADVIDDTLIIVDDSTVNATDGEWEYALPNGNYTVTASVGDPGFADSVHGISVEGEPVISGFTPTGPGNYGVDSASVTVSDGRLTLASTGTNTKLQWITISSASDVDVIPPTVELATTGVTGGGGYVGRATVTATIGDRGGSSIEFVDWTLDGEGVARPAGDALVVDELGAHTVEVTATDAAGNETTRSTAFTVVDGDLAQIRIANQDAQRVGGVVVPGMAEDFLVMHHLNNVSTSTPTHAQALTHNTATLRITNPDPAEPLVVTGLSLSAPQNPTPGLRTSTTNFTTPGVVLPLTVAPGASYDLKVLFGGAGSRGAYGATLTITSNGANQPSLPVQLRGYWQPQPEGGTEPTMTEIARVFGYSTAIGEPLEDAYTGPLQGDEVRSLQWKRLDPSKPVTTRQLTALHGCCNETGDNMASPTSASHDGAWGQSFYPRVAQTGTAPATAPFQQGTATPTGNFNITIAGYTTNKVPTQTDPANLGVRMWPVKIAGRTVPGAFLAGQDFVQNGCGGGSANCDYQDNVFLITNVAPVAPSDVTAPATAPTAVSATVAGNDVRVAWTGVSASDLGGYVVERQAAGATAWTRVNVTPVAGETLTDTGAPGSSQVSYRVLAVDTAGNVSAPSSTVVVTTPARPQAAVRVNAGGPAVTTGGVAWLAQQYGTGGKTYAPGAIAIAGTTDDVIYQSEYSSATGGLDYDIPVENGTYTVRLHFAEIYFGVTGRGPAGAGRRVFDVAVEGTQRIDNYDIFAEVGAATATVKSYDVTVTDGKVDVDLDSVVNEAKVSAIEVLPR